MGAEQELTFRARSQYRNAKWSRLVPPLAGALLEGVLSYSQFGAEAAGWLVGGTLALGGLIFVKARRARTTVGPAGITISSGFGPGRTHPWQEIRWIGVHHRSLTQIGEYSELRITFASGRSRSLPALSRSSLYSDPNFDANCRRIIRQWEANTDPSTRFQPRGNWLYRRTPEQMTRIQSLTIAVVIMAVILLALR